MLCLPNRIHGSIMPVLACKHEQSRRMHFRIQKSPEGWQTILCWRFAGGSSQNLCLHMLRGPWPALSPISRHMSFL